MNKWLGFVACLLLVALSACTPAKAASGVSVSEQHKYYKVLPLPAGVPGLPDYDKYEIVTWVLEGSIAAGGGGQIPFDADLVTHRMEDSVIIYIFWSYKTFTLNPSGRIDTEMALYLTECSRPQEGQTKIIALAQDSWVIDTQRPTAYANNSLTGIYLPMKGLFGVALSGTNRNEKKAVHTVATVTIGFISK